MQLVVADSVFVLLANAPDKLVIIPLLLLVVDVRRQVAHRNARHAEEGGLILRLDHINPHQGSRNEAQEYIEAYLFDITLMIRRLCLVLQVKDSRPELEEQSQILVTDSGRAGSV